MTPDQIFGLANTVVLPAWVLLVFGPRRWPVLNAVPALLVPLGLSVVYAALVLAHFSSATGGGYGSILEVRALFAVDMVLVAGWIHYLAFDLFIGAWAARRMDHAGVSRIVQGFVLPTIFLFGPLGFLLVVLIEAGGLPLRQAFWHDRLIGGRA